MIRLKVYDAVYRLTNPAEQIRAYVYDVVRATLPNMDLDEAFEAKETIAKAIKEQLTKVRRCVCLLDSGGGYGKGGLNEEKGGQTTLLSSDETY